MFDKNIDLDKNILRKNKIPLLHKEPSWNKLFGNVKDKNINYIKENIIKLISREKELEVQSKKLSQEKHNCMKMILGVSDSVNNDNKLENIGLLDEYKSQMVSINEELDEITFLLETIPQEIREVNLKLLNATIQYGYDELKYKEDIVEKSKTEIEILRERLKELITTKHDYEEWINETYLFFHGLLGAEIIEKIDKERLK